MDHNFDTDEIMSLIEHSENFHDTLEAVGSGGLTLTMMLRRHLGASGLSIAEISDQSQLSKPFVYQILNGMRSPGRNALLCLSIAMKVDLRDTRNLLRLAQRGDLYPRVRRDAAIIYAIVNGYSLMRLEELLRELGEKSLIKDS